MPIESWHTPQGSQVLFVQNNHLPMFDLQVVFAAGSARDDGAAGLAQLTLGMLDEGAGQYDALQIAEVFDAVGAQFSQAGRARQPGRNTAQPQQPGAQQQSRRLADRCARQTATCR
nr:insulinase family protein [Pseudomonas sp. BIGb0427]